MKALTDRFQLDFAFQSKMKTLAALCAFGVLTSCDKKREISDSKIAAPSTPAAEHSEPSLAGKRKVVYDVHKEKPEAIFDLLKEEPEAINYTNVRSEAVEAVKEIGERKQVEAIPTLLAGMFVIQPFFTSNALDISQTFPCSEALIKIGEPAVRPVQDQFWVAKSEVEQLILLHVLIGIKGPRFTSDWLGELQQRKLIPERRQRYVELNGWVLSHLN